MRRVVLSLAATLAFAGASSAQTPEVLRGTSFTNPQKKTTATAAPTKPVVQRVAAAPTRTKQPVTPQTLRGSRYGGFAPAPAAPEEPPPALDLASPRTLTLLNVNSSEQLTVTYWSDGAYRREALNKLNHFLRDSKTAEQTEMDPLVFDVLWHTMQLTGYGGTVEVLSAFRSPETN